MAHAPTSLPSTTVLILRGLDKITGRSSEIVAPIGVPVKFATLRITARYCYSTPRLKSPETVAFIQIDDERPDRPPKRVFSGWMYASSPSLNALDHPLYDIWGVSCRSNAPNVTSGAVAALAPPAVKPPEFNGQGGTDARSRRGGPIGSMGSRNRPRRKQSRQFEFSNVHSMKTRVLVETGATKDDLSVPLAFGNAARVGRSFDLR